MTTLDRFSDPRDGFFYPTLTLMMDSYYPLLNDDRWRLVYISSQTHAGYDQSTLVAVPSRENVTEEAELWDNLHVSLSSQTNIFLIGLPSVGIALSRHCRCNLT